MRGATFAAGARVLSMVAAACVVCGCTVRVSDRCNTTDDCLGGVCAGGICQARESADAGAPEVAPGAPALDAMADGVTDTPADTENADSESGDAGSGDAGSDAAVAVDGHAEGGSVQSVCPAWADWPMPSPPSSDIVSDAPRNPPNPQSYDTSDPDVVIDNVTHLVWQGTASLKPMVWSDAAAYCAGLELGGRTGWRLPSRIELVSLIDYAFPASSAGNLNASAFTDAYMGQVWSCSPGVANPTIAWFVDFSDGHDATGLREELRHVRCVTGAGLETPPPARYDLSTPGEVRDTKTRLTWTAAAAPDAVTWGDAYTYCQNLGAGWRLPTLTEAQTLIAEQQPQPALDPGVFPNPPGDYYWTSSYFSGDSETVWFVSTGVGNTFYITTTQKHAARCVR